MSLKLPERVSPRVLVLALLGLATAVKTLWAMNSLGTSDSMLFYYFAKAMQLRPMERLYEGTTVFNHTPLTGWMINQLYQVTGGYYRAFAEILRLTCILADIALLLGLLEV